MLCWDTINLKVKCLNQDQALENKPIWVEGGCRNFVLLVCVRQRRRATFSMHACFLSSNKLGSAVHSDFPEILV